MVSSIDMDNAIDWDVARRVAGRLARRHLSPHYPDPTLEPDLMRLTTQAEELVANETGLPSLAGSARAKVTDRMGWVEANLASFDRLSRPLLGRLDDLEGERDDADLSEGVLSRYLSPISDRITPRVTGAELGAVLGWMSRRVIGQYDLLVLEDERPEEQDWVYYVEPNVVGIEHRYGFVPEEFRLWIALHECTHRAQFTGVPWLRAHFLSLVNELLHEVDPDPARLIDMAKRVARDRKAGRESAVSGGLSTLMANDAQRAVLDQMTGLMSLLEGHGDITMDRAGAGLIPTQPRMARVMTQRRSKATGINKMMQKLLGFDAKLAQYAEGEAFIHAVEAAGGRELFDQVWVQKEHLPSIAEIRDPALWVDRMTASSG